MRVNRGAPNRWIWPALVVGVLAALAFAALQDSPRAQVGEPTGATATPTTLLDSSPPSPTTHAATATASPDPAATPGPPSWPVGLLPQPAASYGGAWPQGAAVGGPGFVAVGSMTPCCADVTPESTPWMSVVWTSTDGKQWDLVPDLETFGRSGLRGIAGDGAGAMLAIGYEVQPAPAGEGDLVQRIGRAWRSTDGIDWMAVDAPDGEFHDVAYADGTWTIAGTTEGQPAVWTSSDPATGAWSTEALPGPGVARAVAIASDGVRVVAGCRGADACDPAVWVAGRDAWQLVTGWTGLVHDVVADGDRFLAVGLDADGAGARSWTSTDGVTWQAGEVLPDANAWQVVVAGDTVVMAGEALDPASGLTQAAVWASDANARRWSPLAILEREADQTDGRVSALLALDGGMVAMGSGFIVDGGQALVWTGPLD